MDIRDSYGMGVFAHGTVGCVAILFDGPAVFVGITTTGDELTGVEVEYT